MSFAVDLEIAEPAWRRARGLGSRLRAAAEAALGGAKAPPDAALTILLSDDRHIGTLNRDFRGKDRPTDVLSFPAAAQQAPYLGDIVLAHGVTEREAHEAGKQFADHATHLVVHGVLHLLGFDHGAENEAKAMEALEVRILAELGIADPYTIGAA